MKPALIAIDWGTTAARAFRFDASGGIIGEHSAAIGVQKIEGGRFAEALKALLGGEIPSGTPLHRLRHDRQPPGLARGALSANARLSSTPSRAH